MRSFLKFAAWVAAVVGIGVAIMLQFFVSVVDIGDDSMAPTVLSGEKALLWRGAEAEMGDFVICENPSEAGTLVMGRVVATTGMTVAVNRNQFMVNGHPFDRDWQGTFRFHDPIADAEIDVQYGVASLPGVDHEFMQRRGFEWNLRNTTVPGGRVYLLSDYHSFIGLDSRAFGPVLAASCIGQVFMRYKPIPEFEHGPPLDHGWLEFLDD